MKNKVFLSAARWLMAAFLVLMGFLIRTSLLGFTPTAMCCFGLAGLMVAWQLITMLRSRHPKGAKILGILLVLCLVIGLILALIAGILIGTAAKGEPEASCDYMIVLGAGVNGSTPSMSLAERIDAAYDYLSSHPDVICVASGGQGQGEYITEAYCIYRELTARGIDGSRIWLEEKSTSTRENLLFSLDLIEEKTGKRPESAGVLSSSYHLYRAGLVADRLGLEAVGIPAKARWKALYCNFFLREIAVVWYYIIFGG